METLAIYIRWERGLGCTRPELFWSVGFWGGHNLNLKTILTIFCYAKSYKVKVMLYHAILISLCNVCYSVSLVSLFHYIIYFHV